jgi:rhodanese-related sulfurtransferase
VILNKHQKINFPPPNAMAILHTPDFLHRAEAARRQIREVDASALKDLLASGATLIDVREEEEFAAGHIPGARCVSGSGLPLQAAGIIPDRAQAVAVVCAGGNRSALVALELQTIGYGSVVSLRGGLNHWPDPLQSTLAGAS